METIIVWAVVGVAVLASRWLRPDWWKTKPIDPHLAPPAARPSLPAGLPDGTGQARRIALHDAQPGDYVAVIGRVVGPADLKAPLTLRTCVAADLVVTDTLNGKVVARVLRAGMFTIDNGRATATVDARGAFVRVEYDERQVGLERTRFEEGTIPATETAHWYTADEGVIAPGQYVLVIGMCERAGAGADADYRSSADSRLHIAGGGVRPSVVSSVPADLHSFES